MMKTMSSLHHSFTGLASSLLLNLGLSVLAEKLDPMLRDGGSIKQALNHRSAAYCESVCNFQSAAYCESVCNFKPVAYCESVCNFKQVAYCESVCNFTPQAS
jgi:hypothetical protein